MAFDTNSYIQQQEDEVEFLKEVFSDTFVDMRTRDHWQVCTVQLCDKDFFLSINENVWNRYTCIVREL